jgi:hypothetical protein
MTLNNFSILLLGVAVLFGSSQYTGSTKAPVVLAGGIIRAKAVTDTKKYKRKDCPVCKGKGWYISGDGIKKVDCGYCEPDVKMFNPLPPSVLNNKCEDGSCTIIRR